MKKKLLILSLFLALLVGAGAVLYPVVIGFPFQKELRLNYIPEKENAAAKTVGLSLNGRIYLHPFSKEIRLYRGKFELDKWGEDMLDEHEISFRKGVGLGTFWARAGNGHPYYTRFSGRCFITGYFDQLVLDMHAEKQMSSDSAVFYLDDPPKLLYPWTTREAYREAFWGNWGDALSS